MAVRPAVTQVDDRRPSIPDGFVSVVGNRGDTVRHRRYLYSRGVSDDDILYYRIGAVESGDMAGRVIFPSFDESGELNFYTGRKISHSIRGASYMTCDTSKDVIFNDCLIDWSLPIVIVEGPFDMVAVGRNAIPLQGKMLRPSSKLFQKVVRRASRVYLALDRDAQFDQLAIADLLYRYCVDVREVDVGGYKDLAEMPRDAVLPSIKASTVYDRMNRIRRLCAHSPHQ
jgi:hypothetical protein